MNIVKYRRKIDIVADILVTIRKEKSKITHIMYKANLSHKILNKYLKQILNANLIFLEGNEYKITEKGEVFLEKYKAYKRKERRILKKLEELEAIKKELERMVFWPKN